ncbi:MAG: TIGR00341 family protein, partial [Desulfotignum sp.]
MAETIFSVSRERADTVIQEITDGSEPGGRFYVLVIVSTMIAGLGLVNNSTAVIIGAMLVAPLMTPIFGISLALIRNDTRLFTRAVEAETAGVAAAIGMGFLLGIITPTLEPTPEMLSRTQPQLFDLLVAIFSGFAGAYALVDEKISPALPGVAIATAIVPPLANTGLCISVGAYAGAFGSFLLFFSNFLAILVVGAVVFLLFRMNRRHEEPDRKVLAKKFLLPVFGIVVITVVFSHALYRISHDRWLKKNIEEVLIEEMYDTPSLEYVDSIFQDDEDRIQVLASVFSVVTITPRHVALIQEALTKRLGKETELTIRATNSHSVSAPGSTSEVTERDL